MRFDIYLIGAKRTKTAFQRILKTQLTNISDSYAKAFHIVYVEEEKHIVNRLSNLLVALNQILHSSPSVVTDQQYNGTQLFFEATNYLFVSLINLIYGASFAAKAVMRQALEIASVGRSILVDNDKWNKFQRGEKEKSTNAITSTKEWFHRFSRIWGDLSNTAVHITKAHLGFSINYETSILNPKLRIGSYISPDIADCIKWALLDLLEISVLIEAFAIRSLNLLDFSTSSAWSKNPNGEIIWYPTGDVKSDLDFIEEQKNLLRNPCIQLELDPKTPEGKEADSLFNGWSLSDLKDQSRLERMLISYPSSPLVNYFMARVYQSNGQFELAFNHYKKSNNILDSIHRLITCCSKLDSIEVIEQCYHEVLKNYPNDGTILNNYGNWLTDQNRFEEAITHLQKSISLDRTIGCRHYNLGRVYSLNNNIKKALSECHKAIKIESNNPGYWHTLGVVYMKKNTIKKAYNCFRKAVSIDPGYLASWLNLAALSILHRNIKKASNLLLYIERITPDGKSLITEFLNKQPNTSGIIDEVRNLIDLKRCKYKIVINNNNNNT